MNVVDDALSQIGFENLWVIIYNETLFRKNKLDICESQEIRRRYTILCSGHIGIQ